MKYLIDTHILIWWAENNKKLKKQYKKIIANGDNIIFVSVASVWEIIIKTKLKKIKLNVPVNKIIEKYNFHILDIKIDHILELNKLEDYHKDPFDRLLVTQSKVEDLILLTDDKLINQYFKKAV
ncbi:PIN domain nuclease [Candidatus Roizmanbacteria bacterium CG11_big_fil_rev_8_21_14_0_20_37_16]|uniref:PIN domain nuclease n=1 Tax=Candidatus Roizmanbacteria bacterium CG11_big_fil_rev_8_21_14_0_20_37_16 TaxID=1974857 RepID=A0A2H0KJW5_9BACT|nr:MAG: PIN domain nuclease [Candidatus Roizmanbacteria bacterium CG11_big_fil_rev_8_21_14_0_20_37_16]